MAYAAFIEKLLTPTAQHKTVFQVLDVIVPTFDAYHVRPGIATCSGVGVVRCEPLMHSNASCPSSAPRVRLSIFLPSDSYASVIHALAENSKSGEIGHLSSWREHLARHCFASGEQVPTLAPKRTLSQNSHECKAVSDDACIEPLMDALWMTH